MQKVLNTPVLLIGFNRPDLFEQVLTQVLLVSPKRIYIALDGPRDGREDDTKNIEQIRAVVERINGPKVITNFQKKNLGCMYGPVTAMNWFFENEEMGIILEDDVKASESFFYFCQELLEKYINDERVGSISGNNYQFGIQRGSGSYYFSRYSHTSGWATWRRAWKKYDIEMKDYGGNSKIINNVFDKYFDKLYWKLIFSGIVNGEMDTGWDYQWNWMMWKHNMLGIIPNVNLVKNIGFGRNDATHTKFNSKFSEIDIGKIGFPLKHPKNILRNVEADKLTQKQNYVLWKEIGMNIIRKWNKFVSK